MHFPSLLWIFPPCLSDEVTLTLTRAVTAVYLNVGSLVTMAFPDQTLSSGVQDLRGWSKGWGRHWCLMQRDEKSWSREAVRVVRRAQLRDVKEGEGGQALKGEKQNEPPC